MRCEVFGDGRGERLLFFGGQARQAFRRAAGQVEKALPVGGGIGGLDAEAMRLQPARSRRLNWAGSKLMAGAEPPWRRPI